MFPPGRLTLRGFVVLLIATGLFAVADGFSQGVLEEDRARYGRVSPGIVTARLSSSGEEGTRTIGGVGRGVFVRTTGFDLYSTIVRSLASGSVHAWVLEYRYPCATAIGTCSGRDFVSHELWSRTSEGTRVNVRQSAGEKTTSRLDENPQWTLALVKTAFGCAMLALAGVLSGRVRLRRRVKYVKASAVVTAIEPVKYGDDTRWRVHFSYFDENDQPQESVDEANDPGWTVGEACVAVYRPQAPDMATLQPLASHGGIPEAGLKASTTVIS